MVKVFESSCMLEGFYDDEGIEKYGTAFAFILTKYIILDCSFLLPIHYHHYERDHAK